MNKLVSNQKLARSSSIPPLAQCNNSGCSKNMNIRVENNELNNNVDQLNITERYLKTTQYCFQNQLKETVNNIRQNDYSYLYKNQKVIEFMRTIRQLKPIMPSNIIQQAQDLLDLIKAKTYCFSYAEIVNKQLLEETNKLSLCLSYEGNRRKVTVVQHETDKIYQHYIQDLETKPRRQSKYYFSTSDQSRIELGELMAQTSSIFQSAKWREIIQITRSVIQKNNLQEVKSDNPQIIKIQRKLDYSSTIYKQHTMNIGCLGCTTHFIKNWNIFDPTVQKTKLVLAGQVIDLIPAKNNKTQSEIKQMTLKKQICGLLNCGGGVILFDCETRYLDVLARGYNLSKSQAKTILDIIENLMQQLQPSPKLGQNIFVSFVPVSKDPISESKIDLLKTNNQNALPEYYGSYVTRIVVKPTIKKTYAYRQDDKLFQSFGFKSLSNDDKSFSQKPSTRSTQNSQKPDSQTDEEVVQEENEYDDWITSLLQKPYTDFDHQECQQPKHGAGIPQNMSDQQLFTDSSIQFDPEQKFKFATALIVRKQNYEQFKTKLKKQDFQNHVQYAFPSSKIKGANVTVILYHNISHTQIRARIASNNNFQFNGRKTITVAITDHIKLVYRLNKNVLPEQQLTNLQQWVDLQFKDDSKCKLQVISASNQYREAEYFIKAVGNKSIKKCALFIYLLTNHYNERSQLKNPALV